MTLHASYAKRCLDALNQHYVELDTARLVVAFYCLSSIDVLDQLGQRIKEKDKDQWKNWIWDQQIPTDYGTGFRPGPSVAVTLGETNHSVKFHPYDLPHTIMTFSAIISLAILGDELSRLDIGGIRKFIGGVQQPDGSFWTIPNFGESDLRSTYSVFALCSLLDCWDAIDADQALTFIRQCRTYEGGYGQRPHTEAQGGTTFCALASLALCPRSPGLSENERKATTRWLVERQVGGFQGRTEKAADACYSFWCGASLKILNADEFADKEANASFLLTCQSKFGGFGKCPGEYPDPYHTYMSFAALSLLPSQSSETESLGVLRPIDPILNATLKTAEHLRRAVHSIKRTL
ncbi:uncharacterized protein EI90DRAFT_2994552 [Cantharellus anzutake]|uniref:uncharacterized protein n=1 Tax=Cantharellus anzutake TaxID=1750568 RepID=UPI001906451E|nr:uncharacterized protein EI90DRAFT_2994552 [Cantharellus anzutake]KAF8333585.1 hypothetical protein EI90DRAFT_2994552 [Cantharellus anzutake]